MTNLVQAAAYDVLVGGQSISSELMSRVEEIRVVDHLHLPDVCTVTIAYTAKEIDSQPFAIGNELVVKLGAIEDRPPTLLFKGDVVTLEHDFGVGSASLTVRGLGKEHRLMRSNHSRPFHNMTSSDIVAKIVNDAGLDVEVEPSGDAHDCVQANETDWDLISRLAWRCGFKAVTSGGVLRFRRPAADSTVQLAWQETLLSFKPLVTAVQQPTKVMWSAQDLSKDVVTAEATQPQPIARIGISQKEVTGAFGETSVSVVTEPLSRSAGSALTQGLLDELANGYVAAEGVALGNPTIKAGTSVTVSGVGSKLSGTYPVAVVEHILRRGGDGYLTRFTSSPTNTILGTIGAAGSGNGSDTPLFATQLVLGEVTNNNDPAGLGRVRVFFPELGIECPSWARVATPSAGKERGLLMTPVPGEEVLVAFEHGELTRPYVVGSLFNGKDTPGNTLARQDGSFGLKSDTAIHAESKGDFTLKSDGRFTVEVAGNVDETFEQGWTNETSGRVSLKAGQPFEVEGRSVTITGSTAVTLRGSASLTLECGGSKITLSGSGVQISSGGGVTIAGSAITGAGPVGGTFRT